MKMFRRIAWLRLLGLVLVVQVGANVDSFAKEIGPAWQEYVFHELFLGSDPGSAADRFITELDVEVLEPKRSFMEQLDRAVEHLGIQGDFREEGRFKMAIECNTPGSHYASSIISHLRRQLRSFGDVDIVSSGASYTVRIKVRDLTTAAGEVRGFAASMIVTKSRREEYREADLKEVARLAEDAGFNRSVESTEAQIAQLEELGIDPIAVLLARIGSERLLRGLLDEAKPQGDY